MNHKYNVGDILSYNESTFIIESIGRNRYFTEWGGPGDQRNYTFNILDNNSSVKLIGFSKITIKFKNCREI
jgi:hypothetical protein